jgi:CO/xanthine dehydrogenase FAD-binding subunit
MWQEYLYPESVREAVDLLAEWVGQACLVAGGTDLVLQLRRGERQAACLIDVSRIKEMCGIQEADGAITVGAAVTHARLAASPLIRRVAPVLAQAASEVGSPEIRNMATIGGNVVNAQPAADTALALLALEAEAEVVGVAGARWVPLLDLYRGANRSAVDSTVEVVRGFRFRIPAGRVGSAYRRLGKCKSIALPVLCAATVVRLEADGVVSAAISLGPVAPRPFRAAEAEQWLAGRPATADTVRQAAALAQDEAQPRDSLLRCAREYRQAMVGVLVQSTLEQALAAAGGAS